MMSSRVLAVNIARRLALGRPVYCQPVAHFATRSPYTHGKHRSNAEALINKVPVVEVADHVAVCDGGSGALGHPVEYIQLDTVSNAPQICKYCGLRFKMKAGAHGHH